jgi:muramoyltetrapeptide carboxypeptidase
VAEASAPSLGVYAISPSGAVPDDLRLQRAVQHLARAGLDVTLDSAARRRTQRFAGPDSVRSAAFQRAARRHEPVVMITRGGYGLTRLLPALDYTALAAANKQWVGLSDFTAFHLAMLARAGARTWAGPSLIEDFGAQRFEDIDETTLGSFLDAMNGSAEALAFRCSGPRGIDVSGTLWGGNLAIVCALLGTPYFPEVEGGILFLEDIGEHPYRIERMLTQLLLAGVLHRQRAILLGCFNGYRLTEHDNGFDLNAVVRWLRSHLQTPVVSGLPFGHTNPKLTLPHGATVGVATEGRTCWIVLPHRH